MSHYIGTGDWTRLVDAESMVPWLYSSSQKTMITYEDEESLQTKLDYVIQHDLGGMMFWELSGDDAQHALVKQMGSALIDGSP